MNRRNGKQDESLLFLQTNPNPMWIFEHKTLKFREVNRAAVLKYGYSRSEFLKMKLTDIRPKDQIPQFLARIRPFRLEGEHIAERQHLTKDGRLIDVELTATQFYFRGRPCVIVEVQDITERKHVEQTFRKLAIVEERNRIARDIHDTLAQGFTGILLQLEAAEHILERNHRKAKEHIRDARNLARQSLEEARRSVWQIRPQQLMDTSLPSAIRKMVHQAKRLGVPVRFSIRGSARVLAAEIESNLLRIAQEALINAIRHAGATRVLLTLSYSARKTEIIVRDNGKGFLPRLRKEGFGLVGIQERAKDIGATVTISSTPGKGCRVVVGLPV